MSAPSSTSPTPSDLRTSAETSEQKLSNLLRWLEAGGAPFPKLRVVRQGNGERAVVAQVDIAPGEVVLQVPLSHMLTLELARTSEIGRRIQSELNPDNEDLYLASFLLQERHQEGSFWKPFLDSLPEAFPHLPLFYGETERAHLKGWLELTLLEFQAQSLQNDYQQLREKVPGYERFTLDEFVWARLSVSSRLFGVKKGGLLGPCLVPLADMLNHRRPPDVLWETSEDGRFFEMTAQNAVAAGDEVHDSYGAKSNDLMLLHFGFVTERNEQDEIFLSLCIPEGDALAAMKQSLLALPSPTTPRPFKVPRKLDHASSQLMFSFLRIAHATPEEIMILANRLIGGAKTIDPLGVANEERVLRALAAACEARLAGFDTSFEEDERLLREDTLAPNARNCVLRRREEKRLLRDYLGLAQTGQALLRLPREEFERQSASPPTPWDWFDGYARQALLELVRRAP